MRQHLVVAETDTGIRLDRFLAQNLPDYSRTYFSRRIEGGDVAVNGRIELRCRQAVQAGDRVDVDFPVIQPAAVRPEELPLDILFEDDWLAVVVKPAGLAVHPGAGRKSGTLANALAHHFNRLSRRDPQRPGIVHRLDRDTSGLLVIAKSERAHHRLARQFQQRLVEKYYLALAYGSGLQAHGRIEAPIGRHPVHRTRMAVIRSGRPALTQYDVLERFHGFIYLRISLKTGRTHQIRVHLSHLNHPVVGDAVYGKGRLQTLPNKQIQACLQQLNRLFLHATLLEFSHPVTGQRMRFESPLPQDLEGTLNFVRKHDLTIDMIK
ncbi:MAG: RluA family pseudouridine synthase [Acidobacteria bacterium]|nr:RluA family pseudouridine synthase [Acidobacteriota bacterium]